MKADIAKKSLKILIQITPLAMTWSVLAGQKFAVNFETVIAQIQIMYWQWKILHLMKNANVVSVDKKVTYS